MDTNEKIKTATLSIHPLIIPVPGGNGNTIFPVLIRSGQELLLVDTGYPGQADVIVATAAEQGITLEGLGKIIITHHDFDHIGSLKALKTMFPKATVMAPAPETDFINGSRKAFRLQQAEAVYTTLPEEAKEGAKQFEFFLRSIAPCPVDTILREGDAVDTAGLVKVIETPGHTEGHISLCIEHTKTLIAGDALVYEDGLLKLANPHYAYALSLAKTSANRIKQLAPETIICYHGGVCRKPSTDSYALDEYHN